MKILLTFLMCCLSASYARCQQDELFFAKVDSLLNLFNNTDYLPVQFEDTSLAVITRISEAKRQSNFTDRSLYLDKQVELFKRDIGVELTGSYLENINPNWGELEDNITYQRRLQAGVQWNVLQGGFLENRAKARILEDRLFRDQIQNNTVTEKNHYLLRFDQTIYVFNVLKISILNERKKQLEQQKTLVNDLVLLKKLRKEELINLESRLAEVQSLLNVYKSYNDYLTVTADSLILDPYNLPLIDLDYENMFNMISLQTDSIMGVHEYNKYYSWYHEIRLSPFARYNFYDLIGPGNRSFFSAGFNVSVPLPFNTKLRNEVENEKWKFDNDRLVTDRISLHEDVLNAGYEFRYKLKQFIGFYQKREMFIEQLRIEKVKVRLRDNNIDPMTGLDLYDDLLRIDIELIDLLQNLYLKALKIHSQIPNSDIRQIVKRQSVTAISEHLDNRDRAVYVWSKTFAEFSPEFLAEYAIYNEFDKIVVAAIVEDTLRKQRELFMNYMDEKTEIHYMLGNNDMLNESDVPWLLNSVVSSYPNTKPDGIHLDIEPHTSPEWSEKRHELLQKYVEFVGKASVWCKQKDLELSISIPLHYEEASINQLFEYCDHIYFMCYENTDIEYINRKIVPFVDNSFDKITLAFRTEDFADRIAMEQRMDQMNAKTQLRSFAYHDLRRIIEFDRKSIEK